MTLAIITALQGGPSAIIQTDCSVLIPNGPANVSFLLLFFKLHEGTSEHLKWSDPRSSCSGDLINQWWKKLFSESLS